MINKETTYLLTYNINLRTAYGAWNTAWMHTFLAKLVCQIMN